MKTYPVLRSIAIAVLAAVGGACLGYVQDDVTQRLASIFAAFSPAFYIGSILGWVVCIVWYGVALLSPSLRRLGIEPTLQGLIFVLTWWLFTVLGGVAFFLLNGMDYMTLSGVVLLSAGSGTAYNFVL